MHDETPRYSDGAFENGFAIRYETMDDVRDEDGVHVENLLPSLPSSLPAYEL